MNEQNSGKSVSKTVGGRIPYRKIFAVLAAFALAGAAQAASIKWSSECKLWDPETNDRARSVKGGVIYLCLVTGGAEPYEILGSASVVTSGSSSNLGKVRPFNTFNSTTIPDGKLKDGDILTVLFCDSSDNFRHLYYVDENGQPTSRPVDDTYVVSGISDGKSTLDPFIFAKNGNFTTATPEPSSGLLLLVGLAGLALRRRQAKL